jgi:hypothetical protein
MNNPSIAALALARQRHATALEHMKDALSTTNVLDRTVRSKCLKYMANVDANKLRIGNSYINLFTANSYFTMLMVVNWNGQMITINCIVSSLHCFEYNEDHPNREPFFVMQNVVLENAIKAQQLKFQSSTKGMNLGTYQHKRLEDLMPQPAKKSCLTFMSTTQTIGTMWHVYFVANKF